MSVMAAFSCVPSGERRPLGDVPTQEETDDEPRQEWNEPAPRVSAVIIAAIAAPTPRAEQNAEGALATGEGANQSALPWPGRAPPEIPSSWYKSRGPQI